MSWWRWFWPVSFYWTMYQFFISYCKVIKLHTKTLIKIMGLSVRCRVPSAYETVYDTSICWKWGKQFRSLPIWTLNGQISTVVHFGAAAPQISLNRNWKTCDQNLTCPFLSLQFNPWTCFIVSPGLWFHGQRNIIMLIALADYRLCVRYISKLYDWPTPCLHNQQRAWMNDQPLAGRVWTVKMGSHTNDCRRPWFPVA